MKERGRGLAAAAAAIAAFDAVWLWIGLPLLSAIQSPFFAVAAKKGTIADIGPAISAYIPARILDGFAACDYFAPTAALGWIVLLAADIAILRAGIAKPNSSNPLLDAQPKSSGGNEHGDAKVLRKGREIERESDIVVTRIPDIETKARGIYLGLGSGGRVYSYDTDEHCLLLAPTRSGKTRHELVEIIAMLGYAGECMTIFDPKGELFGYCSEFLSDRGFTINRIDFDNPDRGNLWNPLVRASEAYRRINCAPKLDIETLARVGELREAAARAKSAWKECPRDDPDRERELAWEYYRASSLRACAEQAGRACPDDEADRLADLRMSMRDALADLNEDKGSAALERAYRESKLAYYTAIYDYEVPEDDLEFELARMEAEGSWRPLDMFGQVDALRIAVAAASWEDRHALTARLKEKKDALDNLLRECETEVNRFVETVHPRDREDEKNAFYADGADNVIKLALHTVLSSATCPDECKTPRTVASIMHDYMVPSAMDPKNNRDDRKAFALYEIVSKLSPEHLAYKYMTILDASSRYVPEFVNEAQGIMELFTGVGVNQMMRGTDYSMEDLVLSDSPTATFIIAPNPATEDIRQMSLLFIEQLYAVLQGVARDSGGRLPRRMNMVCEELGQLPPIKDLEQKLSISGGAGFRWVLVLQDFTQIDNVYGRDARATIVNNTRYNVLVEVGDSVTAKYYSDMFGEYTIEKAGTSTSKAPLGLFNDRVSDSTQLVQRKRMSEAEILQWRNEYGSLLWRRGHPLTIMNTPDLSQTFFNGALGCGDVKHNNEKFARALSRSVHEGGAFVESWGPEIDSIAKLSDLACHTVVEAERRSMRSKHLTGLVADARVKAETVAKEQAKAGDIARHKAESKAASKAAAAAETEKREKEPKPGGGRSESGKGRKPGREHAKPAGKKPPKGDAGNDGEDKERV